MRPSGRAPDALRPTSHMTLRLVWVVLVVALALGAALRLAWPSDIVYSTDERWTFERVQATQDLAGLPRVGMPASVGIPNAGLSLWIFVGLGALSSAATPPELGRAVGLLGVASLIALALFARLGVRDAEREPWLWAVALAAVNPFVVMLQRKIWPPSVLSGFVVAAAVGWWYRARPAGALAWGLAGALLGQIQLPGFFYAAAFAAWTVLFDARSVAWRWWFAGSAAGAVPLVPWLVEIVGSRGGIPSPGSGTWVTLFELRVWMHWVMVPFGLNASYFLGPDYRDFLGWPRIAGIPSYLVLIVTGALAMVTLAVLVRSVVAMWRSAVPIRDQLIGRGSQTRFATAAAVLGFGVVISLSTFHVASHYLVGIVPFGFLAAALLALPSDMPPQTGRRLLVALWLLQATMSVALLLYVHEVGRTAGDGGVFYGRQAPTIR